MPGDQFTEPCVCTSFTLISPTLSHFLSDFHLPVPFTFLLLSHCDHISYQSLSFLVLLVDIMASDINQIEYFVFPDGEEVYLVNESMEEIPKATVVSQLKAPVTNSPHPPTNSDSQGDIGSSDFAYDDNYSIEYKTISGTALLDSISNIIEEVNVIVDLPYTVTRMLLSHFNWDKETFLDRYYACADDTVGLNALLTDAHIAVNGSLSGEKVSSSTDTNQSDEMTCAICYDSFTLESSASLDCGHYYCKSCWVLYLTEKICDQGEAHYISCPDPDCHVYVDDRKVLSLIEDNRTQSKYLKLIINQFVIKNKRLRWCPTIDCACAIELDEIAPSSSCCLNVECGNCHNNFCFRCLGDSHEPVTCSNFSRWKAQIENKDHLESMNYINSNTKDCPNCKVAIEKNGGCNHMTCRSCHHQFCWLCLVDYSKHNQSGFNCNSYQVKVNEKISTSRAKLKRFLHYCDRYLNHNKSLELEEKLKQKINLLKENYVAIQAYSHYELQFMDQALETLKKCRKTLMHTYSFAYYLDTNNQQVIFETNQCDLESATEKLSHYLENSLAISVDPKEVQLRVVNDSRYCESRRQVLIAHVREGYDKGWWKICDNV